MSPERVAEATRPAWGFQIWKVELRFDHQFQKGYDDEFLSALTLSLHSADVDRNERQQAEWHVNSYVCGVRLERASQLVVAGSDSAAKLRREWPRLLGDVLTRVEITAPAGDSVVHFASGCRLVCFPARQTETAWKLTLPCGGTVELTPGKQ